MEIIDVRASRHKQMQKSDMGHSEGHEILIVNVETREGITGVSFIGSPIFEHGEVGDIAKILIERNLRNIVLGKNPFHTNKLWNEMFDAPWRIGMRGMILDCIAAIDFALWDIKGKALNMPVSHLFGNHRDKILTYANVGQQLPPYEMGQQAAEYVKQGHTAVKIRAGLSAVSLPEATERVAKVREAIGPNVKLLVDINGTWDVDTSIDMLKKWREYDIYWLEEPVSPENVHGYRQIKKHSGDTHIVGGEQNAMLPSFQHFIEKEAIDMIQPNAACTGGITNWINIYNYATNLGVPVSPWNLQQIHIPLAIGLSNVKWIEYFTPDRETFQNTLLKGPIYEEVITEEGIFLKGSKAPGLGIEINEKFANETLVR